MNKTVKIILISLAALILVGVLVCGVIVMALVYPRPLVSGDGSKRIVCVGDSLTYAQGVVGSRDKDSFTAILSTLLPDTTVVNYGLPNRTLLSTGNMPYTAESHYRESLAEDADIVIIMLGSNDSKGINWNAERFAEEYEALVKSYIEMDSEPTVYVMRPTRLYREVVDEGDGNNETIKGEMTDIIYAVAEKLHVGVIDLYSITDGHPEWYTDGAHPDAEGNRAIAEEIARVLCGFTSK